MQDFVKDKIKLTDRQLIDQFTNGMGNAFHAYKLNSSINRTFLNCNFKEKTKTRAQIKIQELIEEERVKMNRRKKAKHMDLAKGEKNFWRKAKLKKRNQSVSVAQNVN